MGDGVGSRARGESSLSGSRAARQSADTEAEVGAQKSSLRGCGRAVAGRSGQHCAAAGAADADADADAAATTTATLPLSGWAIAQVEKHLGRRLDPWEKITFSGGRRNDLTDAGAQTMAAY